MSIVVRKHCDAKRVYYYCSPAFNKGFTTPILWPGSCPVLGQKELKYLAITAPFPHPLGRGKHSSPSLLHAPRSLPRDSGLPQLSLPRMQNRSCWESLSIIHSSHPVCYPPPENRSSTSPQTCAFEENSQEAEGVVRRAHLELSDLGRGASQVAQWVKNPPAMEETPV